MLQPFEQALAVTLFAKLLVINAAVLFEHVLFEGAREVFRGAIE